MKRGSLKTVRLLRAGCGLPRSWLRCCLLKDPLSGCLKTKRKTWRSLGKRVGVKAPEMTRLPPGFGVPLVGWPARDALRRWLMRLPACQLRNGLCMRGCCRTICRDAFWQLVGLFLLYLKIPYRENESNRARASGDAVTEIANVFMVNLLASARHLCIQSKGIFSPRSLQMLLKFCYLFGRRGFFLETSFGF